MPGLANPQVVCQHAHHSVCQGGCRCVLPSRPQRVGHDGIDIDPHGAAPVGVGWRRAVAGVVGAGQFFLKLLFADDRERTFTRIKQVAQEVVGM